MYDLISILNEYGFSWLFHRTAYSMKIKMLQSIPKLEILFEKENVPSRLDIFDTNIDNLSAFLLDLNSESKKDIINIADNAIEGKIWSFSNQFIDYGYPINWHKHPFSEITIDKSQKWFNINDFNEQLGDIKVIWEASRFSQFFYFSRAYIITKDAKYYKAFSDQLAHWIKQNPYSYGVNYKDGQEAAIRMITVLLNYSIFNKYSLITENDRKNILRLVEDSLGKITSNFYYADKCIRNNHTISELVALIIGYWCCEDDDSMKLAINKLNSVLDYQFYEDGGYIQKSFNYQRLALQMVSVFLSIEYRLNGTLTDKNKEKLLKSTRQLYNLTNNFGELPNYGHNDGALVFPVSSSDYKDYRPTINNLNYLLTGENMYKNGTYIEETLWFNNIYNEEFKLLEKNSKKYLSSGIFYLKNNPLQLMIVANNFKDRPAHMDQLHMDLSYKDCNIFCDLGTYSYPSEVGRINILNKNHNTAYVSDTDQMNLKGNFFIFNWTERIINAVSNSEIDMSIKNSVYEHNRRLKMLSNNKIEIIDSIVSSNMCTYRIIFNTELKVRKEDNDVYLLDSKNEYIARITSNANCKISQANLSEYYLKSKIINQINYYSKTDKPIYTTVELF